MVELCEQDKRSVCDDSHLGYKEDEAKFSLETLQSCTPVLVCMEKGVNFVNTLLLTGGGMKLLAGSH